MSTRDAVLPWYRNRWPWLLMAGPAIVVVAGFGTLWLAWSTDDGVVADDYYKRGLVINRQLERASRGEALRIGAVLELSAAGGARLTLSGAGEAAAPPTVRLTLANATRAAQDRSAALVRGADGVYAGSIVVPTGGRWLVTVETDAWRLPAVEVVGAASEVRLGSARAVE